MKFSQKCVLFFLCLSVAFCVYAENRSECLARVNRQYSECLELADYRYDRHLETICAYAETEMEYNICVAEAAYERAEKKLLCAQDMSANAANCPME